MRRLKVSSSITETLEIVAESALHALGVYRTPKQCLKLLLGHRRWEPLPDARCIACILLRDHTWIQCRHGTWPKPIAMRFGASLNGSVNMPISVAMVSRIMNHDHVTVLRAIRDREQRLGIVIRAAELRSQDYLGTSSILGWVNKA